jgi:hypothetical protein
MSGWDLFRLHQQPSQGALLDTVSQVEAEETIHRLLPEYAPHINSPLRHVRTRIYFTSESHIHSLVNVLRWGWRKGLMVVGFELLAAHLFPTPGLAGTCCTQFSHYHCTPPSCLQVLPHVPVLTLQQHGSHKGPIDARVSSGPIAEGTVDSQQCPLVLQAKAVFISCLTP